MMSGRSSLRWNLPQCRIRAVTRDCKPPETSFGHECRAPLGGGSRFRCAGRTRLRRLLGRLRRPGWPWWPAVHDVLDLLRVDGFPLEQGFGHRFDLVAIV